MFCSKATIATFTIIAISCVFIEDVKAMPSIAEYTKRYEVGLDPIPACLANCAICKKWWGDFFQGQSCAESCLKFNGKTIINCEDEISMAPFMNRLK